MNALYLSRLCLITFFSALIEPGGSAMAASESTAPKSLTAVARRPAHPVLIRNEHNPLLRVTIEADASLEVRVNEMSFTLEGTDDLADLESLSLFSTRDKEEFAPTQEVGEAVPPKARWTIRAAHNLFRGHLGVRDD